MFSRAKETLNMREDTKHKLNSPQSDVFLHKTLCCHVRALRVKKSEYPPFTLFQGFLTSPYAACHVFKKHIQLSNSNSVLEPR